MLLEHVIYHILSDDLSRRPYCLEVSKYFGDSMGVGDSVQMFLIIFQPIVRHIHGASKECFAIKDQRLHMHACEGTPFRPQHFELAPCLPELLDSEGLAGA